jgi:hypothetical protein
MATAANVTTLEEPKPFFKRITTWVIVILLAVAGYLYYEMDATKKQVANLMSSNATLSADLTKEKGRADGLQAENRRIMAEKAQQSPAASIDSTMLATAVNDAVKAACAPKQGAVIVKQPRRQQTPVFKQAAYTPPAPAPQERSIFIEQKKEVVTGCNWRSDGTQRLAVDTSLFKADPLRIFPKGTILETTSGPISMSCEAWGAGMQKNFGDNVHRDPKDLRPADLAALKKG